MCSLLQLKVTSIKCLSSPNWLFSIRIVNAFWPSLSSTQGSIPKFTPSDHLLTASHSSAPVGLALINRQISGVQPKSSRAFGIAPFSKRNLARSHDPTRCKGVLSRSFLLFTLLPLTIRDFAILTMWGLHDGLSTSTWRGVLPTLSLNITSCLFRFRRSSICSLHRLIAISESLSILSSESTSSNFLIIPFVQSSKRCMTDLPSLFLAAKSAPDLESSSQILTLDPAVNMRSIRRLSSGNRSGDEA